MRFAASGEHFFSTGGVDSCLLQWEYDDVNDGEDEVDLDGDDAGVMYASAVPGGGGGKARAAAAAAAQQQGQDAGGGGDAFRAARPWVGAVAAPDGAPTRAASLPSADLVLEWVHGYAAQGPFARNNARYGRGDAVVFPAASLGVCMSESRRVWSQGFNQARETPHPHPPPPSA